jgi:phenylacetate-CoA ligase
MGIRVMEKARHTDGLALLPRLEESQWRSHEDLLQDQGTELKKHLLFCLNHVPHYRKQFAELGFRPEDVSSVADLGDLPLLDKMAIRAAGDDLLSTDWKNLGPRSKTTSGSTGVPLNYKLDFKSHSYLWAHIWRAWAVTGYRPGDLYATLSGGSLLPEKVDFKQRVYLFLSGCVHLPSYHLTNEIMTRYARRLASKNVRFLYGYPSSLELFASFLLDSGLPTSSMQAVFTTSELLSPGARRTIETAFGCPVFDLYGCNDGGLYSFECEHHNGFHQAMESCIVEVVDDEGLPLPEGEMGRIVTTHLANRCHPFLRYVTGDVGALDSTPCACGRGLVRIVHIQGRERDFVLTPGGRMVHGAFFNHFEPFYKSEWLERFQVHQPSQDRLIVRLIVQKQPTEQEQSEMIAQLKRGLGEMEITIDIVDELVLTETGKFRVVTSDLN